MLLNFTFNTLLSSLYRVCFIILFSCYFLVGCSVKNAITELFAERGFSNSLAFIDDNTQATQDKLLDSIPTKFVGYIGAPIYGPKVRRDRFFSFAVHEAELASIAVTADGLGVYSADEAGNVFYSKIVEGSSLKLQSRLLMSTASKINMLALSADERFMAVCLADKIVLADLLNKKVVAELSQISGRVTALSWSKGNEYLAIGQTGRIILWKIFENEEFIAPQASNAGSLETYKGGITPIIGVHFYSTGKIMFSADSGGFLNVKRLLKTEREMGFLGRNEKNMPIEIDTKNVNIDTGTALEDFVYDEVNNELITASNNGSVLWWKIRGLVPIKMLDIGGHSVKNVVLLSKYNEKTQQSENYFATSSSDNIVKLWYADGEFSEVASKNSIKKLPKVTKLSRTMRFISNEKSLYFQSDVFDEPISEVGSARGNQYLWLGQKSGKIIVAPIGGA